MVCELYLNKGVKKTKIAKKQKADQCKMASSLCFVCCRSFQSVVPSSIVSASPGNFFKMHILGLHFRHTD